MILEHYADDLVVWAPAKVNLFLEVLRKRDDGYHEIETFMVAVQLYDTLVLREDASDQIHLDCHDANLSTGPDNLVVRAAQLLQSHAHCRKGARIRLVKRIPMEAGLAGGSADAAATLTALNRLWKLDLPVAQLAKLGAQLGSDVPFFLHTPAAWCSGRGEIVAPIPLPKRLTFVIVTPAVGSSTAAVYRKVEIQEQPNSGDAFRKALATGDTDEIGRHLHNRLQGAAIHANPMIANIGNALHELKPTGCMMSGSGSSWFALVRDRTEGRQLARDIRRHPTLKESRVFLVRSCS